MRFTTMLGILVCTGVPAWAEPDRYLLAPADPKIAGRPVRYAPVTAGVKRFDVVEPKDWIELNKAVGPQGSKDRQGGKGDGVNR